MNAKSLHEQSSHAEEKKSSADRIEGRLEPRFPHTPPTEAHWDELHTSGRRIAAHQLSQRLKRRSWSDIAVGVAAGAVVGWWLASRQSHGLLPSASRGAHQLLDAVRDHDVLRDWSDRLVKLKNRW